MDIQKFPTDNLYKFMAISGLTITIASFIFPFRESRSLALKVIEVQAQGSRLNEEVKFLEKQVSELENESEKDAGMVGIKDRALLLRDAIHQMRLKSIEWHTKTEELKLLADDLRFLERLANIGFLIGILMGVPGFWLWYWKLQYYQDAMLRTRFHRKK